MYVYNGSERNPRTRNLITRADSQSSTPKKMEEKFDITAAPAMAARAAKQGKWEAAREKGGGKQATAYRQASEQAARKREERGAGARTCTIRSSTCNVGTCMGAR